jgi:hypothetical protein
MAASRSLYPTNIYVRSGKEYIEVDCKTSFCFGAIRKKLAKSWDISSLGPKIDKNNSEGTIYKPLDISDL